MSGPTSATFEDSDEYLVQWPAGEANYWRSYFLSSASQTVVSHLHAVHGKRDKEGS